MASYLYTTEGYATGATGSIAHRYNNDTGVWTTLTSPPAGPAVSSASIVRQEGGWDGNFWYTILENGKLYRYNPATDTWSGSLASGTVIIAATIEDQNWSMCSDGRFIYIFTSSGFRRYDSTNDALTILTDQSLGSFGPRIYTVYDGFDIIYLERGAYSQFNPAAYTISTMSWSQLSGNVTVANTLDLYAEYLGGRLWVITGETQGTMHAYMYAPASGTWTTKSTHGSANGIRATSVYGELNDSTVRIWCDTAPGAGQFTALDYNIANDSWADGPTTAWDTRQGANWAVGRAFNPTFTWYLADGVTPAAADVDVGGVSVGDSILYHFTLLSLVDRAGGATISVPPLALTDAEDPVTVCATANGTFAASFVTGPIIGGVLFDVYVRIVPTNQQTLGLSKTFNLRPVVN